MPIYAIGLGVAGIALIISKAVELSSNRAIKKQLGAFAEEQQALGRKIVVVRDVA